MLPYTWSHLIAALSALARFLEMPSPSRTGVDGRDAGLTTQVLFRGLYGILQRRQLRGQAVPQEEAHRSGALERRGRLLLEVH